MGVEGRITIDEDEVLELALDDAIDPPPPVSGDERRMHVRAYNYWASLLDGRPLPAIVDLDVAAHPDFGPHAVLLDVTHGPEAAQVAWLGERLRAECDLPAGPMALAEVPPRSLLSRLTDHHLQIIANRAPVGFEAEFVSAGGVNTAYRGILMPFASDGDTIDWVLGVINWKEVALLPELAALQAQFAAVASEPQRGTPEVPAWQDGPHATLNEQSDEPESLADQLAAARESADAVRQAEVRTRGALYQALSHAYDFALEADAQPGDYAELLAECGVSGQARAPMTPVVKLVFGVDYDKTRLTEYASALTLAKRHDLPRGGMKLFLEQYPGGLKALVAAERRSRRPEARARPDPARERARKIEGQLVLTLPGDDEFVVLVARRVDPEHVAVIGVAPDDKPLVDRALRGIITSD